jgi:hypothetical protein
VASPKKSPPSEPSTDGSRVWVAYAEAYRNFYQSAPERNSKNNKHAADIVKRVGVENALQVVKFYLTDRSPFYVAKVHGLQQCLNDCEGLLTRMRLGDRKPVSDPFNGRDLARDMREKGQN